MNRFLFSNISSLLPAGCIRDALFASFSIGILLLIICRPFEVRRGGRRAERPHESTCSPLKKGKRRVTQEFTYGESRGLFLGKEIQWEKISSRAKEGRGINQLHRSIGKKGIFSLTFSHLPICQKNCEKMGTNPFPFRHPSIGIAFSYPTLSRTGWGRRRGGCTYRDRRSSCNSNSN